jgi:hypothetical protein
MTTGRLSASSKHITLDEFGGARCFGGNMLICEDGHEVLGPEKSEEDHSEKQQCLDTSDCASVFQPRPTAAQAEELRRRTSALS